MKSQHELTLEQQAAVARKLAEQLLEVGQPRLVFNGVDDVYEDGVEEPITPGTVRESQSGVKWVSWGNDRWYRCLDYSCFTPEQLQEEIEVGENPLYIVCNDDGIPLGTDRQGPLCILDKPLSRGFIWVGCTNTGWNKTNEIKWKEETPEEKFPPVVWSVIQISDDIARYEVRTHDATCELFLLRSDQGDGGWSLFPSAEWVKENGLFEALLSGPSKFDAARKKWARPNAADLYAALAALKKEEKTDGEEKV